MYFVLNHVFCITIGFGGFVGLGVLCHYLFMVWFGRAILKENVFVISKICDVKWMKSTIWKFWAEVKKHRDMWKRRYGLLTTFEDCVMRAGGFLNHLCALELILWPRCVLFVLQTLPSSGKDMHSWSPFWNGNHTCCFSLIQHKSSVQKVQYVKIPLTHQHCPPCHPHYPQTSLLARVSVCLRFYAQPNLKKINNNYNLEA